MSTTKKSYTDAQAGDPTVTVGGVALIDSIRESLAQCSTNQELQFHAKALQDVVDDWQTIYQSIDNQLRLALDVNQNLNEQVSMLRSQFRANQGRFYRVEQQTLALGDELRRTKVELEKAEQQVLALEEKLQLLV